MFHPFEFILTYGSVVYYYLQCFQSFATQGYIEYHTKSMSCNPCLVSSREIKWGCITDFLLNIMPVTPPYSLWNLKKNVWKTNPSSVSATTYQALYKTLQTTSLQVYKKNNCNQVQYSSSFSIRTCFLFGLFSCFSQFDGGSHCLNFAQ